MIEIKTQKNYLVKDSKKDGFCSRNKTNKKINYTEMAREFKEFNSSLTEPDALSMFSIMNTLVCKYVAKGYTVELPFCKIYNRAIGTADDIKSAFTPDVNNNQFVVTMELTPNAKTVMTTDVEYLQRSPEVAGKPVAFYVYPLAKDGKDIKNPDDEKNLSVKHGQALRFHGNNLRCDISDSEQGLFFVATDKSEIRLDSFTRCGSNVIDFVVPQEIPNAEYKIVIRTKTDAGRLMEAASQTIISVVE